MKINSKSRLAQRLIILSIMQTTFGVNRSNVDC